MKLDLNINLRVVYNLHEILFEQLFFFITCGTTKIYKEIQVLT